MLLGARGLPALNSDVWGIIFSFLVDGRGPRAPAVDVSAFAAGLEAAGSLGKRGCT